jgi:hypothetical protein
MIQNLWTFAEGLPWWAWVLVGLAVLYLFTVASGSIYSRELWTMLQDQVVILPTPSTDLDGLVRYSASCLHFVFDDPIHFVNED